MILSNAGNVVDDGKGGTLMRFSADDVEKFPRCTTHMKHDLSPRTFKKDRKKIYDAFIRACGTEKGAIKALAWGTEPRVSVTPGGLIKIAGQTMCGFNTPTYFNQNDGVVIISEVRLNPLEKCVAEVDLLNNKRRFECTLLHEMVHFVRMRNGLPDEDWDFPDSHEVGDQFEIWAYGELLCSQKEIEDALLSYM